MKRILIIVVAIMTTAVAQAQHITTQDKQRAAELVSQMTLREKLEYIGGVKSFYIRAVPRLGIPEIRMADGPQGVRNNTKSTLFPSGIALAATWNRDLAHSMGEALGQDCRARGVHILLGPGVNIYRSPLCGRNFEYFGEDPYLTSETAVEYIKGVQSKGVMACVKHFAANNQEWDRHNVSSDVDRRTMQEIYLPAFRKAVTQAEVGAVMDSYNLVNTVHSTESRYLNDELLRRQWGFDGIVMSDWTSVYSAAAVANGGLDLEMPRGKYMNPELLMPLVESGVVDERTIDTKVQHILQTLIAFGFLDREQKDESIGEQNPFSDSTALAVAQNAVVLLKNDGILPLKLGRVSLIGVNATTIPTGGGSGFVYPFSTVSVSEGMQQMKGFKVTDVPYVTKHDINSFCYTDESHTSRGLKSEYFTGKDFKSEPLAQGLDTVISYDWGRNAPRAGVPADNFSVRWSGVMCSPKDVIYRFRVAGDDGFRMIVDDKQVAGSWSAQARRYKECILHLEANRDYRVRFEYYDETKDASMEVTYTDQTYTPEQMDRLRKASVVVACLGFDNATEGEGFDRTFTLPEGQVENIKAIAAINPNLVVVLNGGGGFEMESWIDYAKAVVMAWYPGQQGGLAVAQILAGRLAPSGRLPISIERCLSDNPTYESYYHNIGQERDSPYKRVTYSEGVFTGYRGFERKGVARLFPFGYGLTYTTFDYSSLKVNPLGADSFRVELDVTNTGRVDAAEVVQVYVGEASPKVVRPAKELKGYAKVFVPKGKTRHVSIDLGADAFEYYDIVKEAFTCSRGKFNVFVGSSSADIRLQKSLEL